MFLLMNSSSNRDCSMMISFSLTSSNMVLKVCMAEYCASICSSMCTDLSRISSVDSVLMSEWCLVRSLCSSCIWSFSFWISVCRIWFKIEVYVYVQLANIVCKKILTGLSEYKNTSTPYIHQAIVRNSQGKCLLWLLLNN